MQLVPKITGTVPLEPVRGRVPIAIGATAVTPSTATARGTEVVGGVVVPLPPISTPPGTVVVAAVLPCGMTAEVVVVAGASVVVVTGTTITRATVVGTMVVNVVVVVGATVTGATVTGATVATVVVVTGAVVVVVDELVHVVVGVVQGELV